MDPVDTPAPVAFDSAHFRRVLSHFCSGVTVIAGMSLRDPVGFACQSFQSLSLDPPLVSFAVARTSTSWPRIVEADKFAVSVLTEEQALVCRSFAVSGGPTFDGVAWQLSSGGCPVLSRALAWIDCTVERRIDAGDHELVIGQVRHLDVVADAGPLLFFKGEFGKLAPSSETGSQAWW